MNTNFITFRKFDDPVFVQDLITILKTHDIGYAVEENSISVNPLFALNTEVNKEYEVKIANENFDRVNELLIANESIDIYNIPDDHYLYQFTNEQLIDILIKSEEWSTTDYVLAKKLLQSRSVNVDETTLIKLKEQHLNDLRMPAPPQTIWILIGYIFALLGGVLGLFVGWHLKTHKKTLPNGDQVYSYRTEDRKHGNMIFIIGLVCLFTWLAYRLFITPNGVYGS